MLIDRARFILLSFAFSLLASCGGGGGDAGRSRRRHRHCHAWSSRVANLPRRLSGAVRVAGPAGFSREITADHDPDRPGRRHLHRRPRRTSSAAPPPISRPSPEQRVTARRRRQRHGHRQLRRRAAGARPARSGRRPATPCSSPRPTATRACSSSSAAAASASCATARMLTLPFLDISGRVSMQGEGGLLSMAFHPQFASNGHFFVYYTDFERNIVVERYTVSPNRDIADPTSALQIISIPHPGFTNHFGGLVAFGPDGFLYLGTGDGGGARRSRSATARTSARCWARCCASTSTAPAPPRRYAIPPGNPFVGQAGRRGEIWACGLRNPWRFAFDTSGLYIADVGQDRREEVNLARPAAGRPELRLEHHGRHAVLRRRHLQPGRADLAGVSNTTTAPTTSTAARSSAATSTAARRSRNWPGATSTPTTAAAS